MNDYYVLATLVHVDGVDEFHYHPMVMETKLTGNKKNNILYSNTEEGAVDLINSLPGFGVAPHIVEVYVIKMAEKEFEKLQTALDNCIDDILIDVDAETDEVSGFDNDFVKMQCIMEKMNNAVVGMGITEDGEFIEINKNDYENLN